MTPDSFTVAAGQWLEHALGMPVDAETAARVADAAMAAQALIARRLPGTALFDVPPGAFDRAIAAPPL